MNVQIFFMSPTSLKLHFSVDFKLPHASCVSYMLDCDRSYKILPVHTCVKLIFTVSTEKLSLLSRRL